ncbi:DUF5342 family protein [Bacillus chungangensis]|uniref:YheE family protein n=1 Tax=Bacillus chungangensis TaxID=587633 RepID=A0ABT9WNE5_9BACI|nr:DUF5342 family protein [Bacillus chungangensis]MDQ0174808.1 hypothetical protein [Bacillus chungangensis]
MQHFQYESLYHNEQIPGWRISFYFKKQKWEGIYHSNGKIEWRNPLPAADQTDIEKQVHELMIFHVYDQQK